MIHSLKSLRRLAFSLLILLLVLFFVEVVANVHGDLERLEDPASRDANLAFL